MARTAEAQARRTGKIMANELEELIESASELLESVKDQQGDAIDAVRSRASRTLENARRRAADFTPQVRETATRAAQAATGFARRNPWSAVAIGAVIAASIATLIYAGTSRK